MRAKSGLEMKLDYMFKMFHSMCILSPYANLFNNKYSQNMAVIRKKFILDYDFEYKNLHEMLKDKPLSKLPNSKVYEFTKTI